MSVSPRGHAANICFRGGKAEKPRLDPSGDPPSTGGGGPPPTFHRGPRPSDVPPSVAKTRTHTHWGFYGKYHKKVRGGVFF